MTRTYNTLKLEDYDSPLGFKFRSIVKGSNFVTPFVKGYTKIKNYIVEITTGNKFIDLTPFGITVVIDELRNNKLSTCVYSMEEVEEYINNLP